MLSDCRQTMFKSKTDERVTRSQATGIVSAFLRSTVSQQLSEDVSHKLLIVRKFISRRRGDKEKAEEGCFHSHLVECKFGLTAAELGDAETAITQKLSAYVLGAHVMEYMGVLLAFSKFEVPQFTPLKWDLPHIFVTVTVRMLVFDPAHSDLLCKSFFIPLFNPFSFTHCGKTDGQVSKVAKDHVPLLVFGVFNANVPKDEKSSELTVGTEVAFKVVGMDVQSLPIMINGKLLTEKHTRKHANKRERTEETAEQESNEAPKEAAKEGNNDEHSKKSKKHKTEDKPESSAPKEEAKEEEEVAPEPAKKRHKHKSK